MWCNITTYEVQYTTNVVQKKNIFLRVQMKKICTKFKNQFYFYNAKEKFQNSIQKIILKNVGLFGPSYTTYVVYYTTVVKQYTTNVVYYTRYVVCLCCIQKGLLDIKCKIVYYSASHLDLKRINLTYKENSFLLKGYNRSHLQYTI